MTWLDSLTEDRRSAVVDLAQKKNDNQWNLLLEKKKKKLLRERRIRKMESDKLKAQQKEEWRQNEIEMLSRIPIIHTVEDLYSEIKKIEGDKSSTIPGKENLNS